MFFWNSLAFPMIQQTLAIWSLVPLPFLKPAWTSGSSRFTYCWSLAWKILSITLLECELSVVVWAFFSILVHNRKKLLSTFLRSILSWAPSQRNVNMNLSTIGLEEMRNQREKNHPYAQNIMYSNNYLSSVAWIKKINFLRKQMYTEKCP